MKTKTSILFIVTSLLTIHLASAQMLRKKIGKSVEVLRTQINTLPKEKINELDQVAFKIYKNCYNNSDASVLFIDQTNTQNSQLAMIWLKTGLAYYAIDINVQSAGVSLENKPISNLNSLSDYGFVIKTPSNEKPNLYTVIYGRSGSWSVFPKALSDIKKNNPMDIKIIVDKALNDKGIALMKLELNEEDIPLQIIYIAAQLDHLIKNKI
ncbi:hypothetical protein GGR42_000459 [Saonia flava]|uniref:Uncharacterized protein n=1 Tax=Saonia flava TaxID=523696 RepID=A0A846QS24_9FLAO|nr:hypothetical protein [Saonia flava]NJB69997.1 hypothetical protein [Saonia flava]